MRAILTGAMANLDRLLGTLLGSGIGRGAALGALGGLFLGRRRRGLGALGSIGAMAAIGALAEAAFRESRGEKARHVVENETIVVPSQVRPEERLGATPGPPPLGARFAPADEEEASERGLLLVRAMIAAAYADGKLDATESQRVLARVDELALDADEKALLLDELRRPAAIESLAAAARTPEVASQVYAAALLAVDVDTPAEHRFFQDLARALHLDAALVERLEAHAASA